ncbi:MAG: DUF2723 domain-containing protein [Candidatus Eisenbacteria bacterium]|uniref:DUF2723 domain-containing protein n=1 Tax=Eiseniibacteriota bacterium TaxID=2212470 RepID=A0A948RSP1_UNCEI|nr:DUF2723 domain-containing protein [Candidatus Eisenbacteria bacterium]MBU1948166.1 DUF2723 domain-containing protein [Candidatus Eisenbacteria bacterium]MBU2690165.1 DUF2723 domain-containing protein [Candidatus Eisenbacteria bacterium]
MRRSPPAWLIFILAAAPPLGLYVTGLQRDLGTIDSGELAAVGRFLGIAHPPGYPLYTFLGRVWGLLPLGTPLTRLHLLSAVSCALAVGFAALALRKSLTLLGRKDEPPSGRGILAGGLPLLGAWAWGLSPSVWRMAVVNEVYGLHYLILAVCLWLGVSLLQRQQNAHRRRVLLVYVLGLGFCHHLSLFFAVPSLLLALAVTVHPSPGRSHISFWPPARRWLSLLPWFLLGLSCQLYLPLRSAQGPLLNWGHPTTLGSWFRHASGWQYRIWLFSGSESLREAAHRIPGLLADLNWILPLAAVPGLILLWRRRAALGWFWVILCVVSLLWASSYNIPDIQSYYAASDLAVVALGVLGLHLLTSQRWVPLRLAGPILGAVLCATMILGIGQRWNRCAASGPPLPGIYARSLLEGLPPNTLLLSRQWDAFTSNAIYLQWVEGCRPDVAIVDTELMHRSWYFTQLDRWYPHLLDPVRPQLAVLLEDLELFETGRPFNRSRRDARHQALQLALLNAYAGSRPVAMTPEAVPNAAMASRISPYGLVFLLNPTEEMLAGRGPLPPIEPFLQMGPRTDDSEIRIMRQVLATMTMARAQLMTGQGDDLSHALQQESRRLQTRLAQP